MIFLKKCKKYALVLENKEKSMIFEKYIFGKYFPKN